MTPGSASRKKIAILGGGMGGMSAAYWLTNRPGWQEDYEITLYQMGWRLGGKGATGRNPEMFQRIEEHGFHFFPGFYENTFAMMRQCYEELGRGSEAPLSEFIAPTQADEHRYPDRYAMHRFNFGGMQEPFNGQWYKFSLYLPENDALPGSGVEHPTAWEYIQMGIDWMWTIYQNSAYWTEPGSPDNGKKEAWWDELSFILDLFVLEAVPLFPSNHLYAAKHIIDRLPTDGESHASRQYLPAYEFIIRRLRSHQKKLWNQVKDEVVTNFRAYSAWTLQDFVATTLIGMLHDEVMLLGFDVVNDLDFSAWMLRHATIPEGTAITIRTPMVRFVYDAGFSVLERDGRIVSEIEAGTALRIGMRMFVYYTGSVFWMFQAGCGETIFAPLYQVLKRRGVKFEFFHKVINLHTNHDTGNDTITELEIQQQAHLKVGEYDPLVMIKGLPCWSSEPAYEQLVEGDILRERQINLESNWSDWQGVGTKHLKRGEDFDDVILAIPLAGLPQIFPDCFKKSSWQMMHEKLMTTRTQSIQLYTNKTQSQMGWTLDRPLLELDNEPISTWADMTPQRRRENWLPELLPKTINYFVGFMPDDPFEPAGHDPDYPHTQDEVVKRGFIRFLNVKSREFWTYTVKDNRFDWSILVDKEQRVGEDRLNAQYLRANIDPTERYILSVPDSSRYRLAPAHSGFKNLYLAGDWVKTGLNYGCMEAAAMSGMMVSRALSAYPLKIYGESDFNTSVRVVPEWTRIIASVIDSGADLSGGIAAAVAAALLEFRQQVNLETLKNEPLLIALLKGIFDSNLRFAAELKSVIERLRQDLQGLYPYRERIDYDRLAAQVIDELSRQQTSEE